MGEHNLHPRNPDDQDVCPGRAEIVLNQQGAAGARRRCRRTGVVEFKRGGFLDASHLNAAIRGRSASEGYNSLRAVDFLGRYVGLQLI